MREQRRNISAIYRLFALVRKKGQVLRDFHDPDELVIIAGDFDKYLKMLMDEDYGFILEDNIEEWE